MMLAAITGFQTFSDVVPALERFGFIDILLWLLTFAIVFGVLSQVNLPKNRGAQGIISIVFAFFVLFATPTSLITAISQMSTAMLLLVLAFLIFIVFIEAAGVRTKRTKIKGLKHPKTGKKVYMPEGEEDIFHKYGKYFAIIFVIIAFLVFLGAGGFDIIGIDLPGFEISHDTMIGTAFFIFIALAVLWLIANPTEKK